MEHSPRQQQQRRSPWVGARVVLSQPLQLRFSLVPVVAGGGGVGGNRNDMCVCWRYQCCCWQEGDRVDGEGGFGADAGAGANGEGAGCVGCDGI